MDKARTMLAHDGNPFQRALTDPDGDVSLAFGITGVPESFLIDANGTIVKTLRGPLVGNDARIFLRRGSPRPPNQARRPSGDTAKPGKAEKPSDG